MIFPRKRTFSDPKTQFSSDSLITDLRKHLKMSCKLGASCSVDSTPHPLSSMNCVQTLAERHGSKYFLPKALNPVTDLFRPLASLW